MTRRPPAPLEVGLFRFKARGWLVAQLPLPAWPAAPTGAALVRIRTELVEHVRAHCSPFVVALAEERLASAVAAMPRRMEQLRLFERSVA